MSKSTTKKMSTLAVASVIVALGCGGSNSVGGFDSSAKVSSLSTADQQTLCSDLAAMYPKKTVTCGSSSTTVGTSADQCGSGFTPIPAACSITVGDVEACAGDLYGDPCTTTIPTPCAPLFGSDCQ